MTRLTLVGLFLGVSLCCTRRAEAASCGFNSVTSVVFGGYDVFSSTPNDGVGQLVFQCTVFQLLDTIQINLSTGSSNTYSARTMQKGSDTLSYQLYLDPARTQVWGDKSSGTVAFTQGINLLATTVPIYGRIPARQNAKAGDYTDTVVITLMF